ncbi:MAG TPA: hypothetical protein VK821_20155, partial [Dehalococcoidia bacterium]|nr:hypothetical protein [Dehalococcoidia bacterium]
MVDSEPPYPAKSRSGALALLRTSYGTAPPAAFRLVGFLLVAVVALGIGPVWPAWAGTAGSGQTAGASVTYPVGWNLVAFTPGTDLTQVSGPMYTYQPSLQSYEPVQSDQALLPGAGFWVYFAAPTTVVLGAGSTAPVSAGLISQQWAMLGDPSGTTPAIIPALIMAHGSAYTYDPLNGYQPLTGPEGLLPGKGVWATPAPGWTITITPTSLPASDSVLTSIDLTSPCAAALATHGFTGEGNGEALGEVDGQPVSVCPAAGPRDALPAVEGFGCLLVGGKLALFDGNGGRACLPMVEIVPQGTDLFLWVEHISADAESVIPLSWNGSSFQSSRAYTVCGSNLMVPVASAGQ